MMNVCFKFVLYCLLAVWLPASGQYLGNSTGNSDSTVLAAIAKFKPYNGAVIPKDIRRILGSSHIAGKYNFTNEPFLIEGANRINELGFGICKLWFYKYTDGYSYHSDWNLPSKFSLKDLAAHPYYQQVFDLPFSTIMLGTHSFKAKYETKGNVKALKNEEKEFYELTKYLLEKYKDREVTFILQNWEGDWLLRGGTGPEAHWEQAPDPKKLAPAIKNMRLLFKARQDGVSRARAEVKLGKCKVYNAIEVNKVIDCMNGMPGLTTDVLPFVETDMVSWSSYDATEADRSGVLLYKGIDFIKEHMRPTSVMEKKVVFIGEIGISENTSNLSPAAIKSAWDNYVAACLAQNIPYIVQWQVFSNEAYVAPDGAEQATAIPEKYRGFWLIRPDGTKSYTMEYFDELLKNAGHPLNKKN